MAITTRDELIETLALVGVMGAARNGDLDGVFDGGGYTLPSASTTVVGGVKQTVAVTNLAAQTVTDIATAQTAITAIVNKLNSLIAAQRTAGQIAT